MPVNILNLPGLRVLDFKETDTEYHIKAEPAAFSRLCPHCGQSHSTIGHGKLPLFVRDIPSHGKQVMVHLDAPRLLCKLCNKSFTATVSELDGKRQMTERLVKWIGSQALDYTFAAIAQQVGIYELYLSRAYRCVFTNLKENTVIDMLPSRNKPAVSGFLQSLPDQKNIEVVCIDMHTPYRDASRDVLHHADIVVDKFHITRMANEALDAVRKNVK